MCVINNAYATIMVFLFQHRDTADNNPDTPFEFTAENKKVKLASVLNSIIGGFTDVAFHYLYL